jgi:hypothetical protein
MNILEYSRLESLPPYYSFAMSAVQTVKWTANFPFWRCSYKGVNADAGKRPSFLNFGPSRMRGDFNAGTSCV